MQYNGLIGILLVLMAAPAQGQPGPVCEGIPREENASLPLSEASDDWFRVYESAESVYSIVEPYHYQETISHLIVGENRAILFDTGMGFLPIRPVVERLTSLPVTVLNSHTHYDHVGGNAEFSSILAVDSAYTRSNTAGFRHDRIASDLGAHTFCKAAPASFDPDSYHTRPWRPTGEVVDGQILDLGGRKLEVLHVPGHTPDAVALLDAGNGLLFTGDSFYDAAIWLFVPETSLADYGHSIARLANLESKVEFLLGAHNVARVEAGALSRVERSFAQLVSGKLEPVEDIDGQLLFDIEGIQFLTAKPVLDGRRTDVSRGGSGIDAWD